MGVPPLPPSGALQAALQMWIKQMMFDMTDTKLDHAYVTCAGYFLPGGQQQAVPAAPSPPFRCVASSVANVDKTDDV